MVQWKRERRVGAEVGVRSAAHGCQERRGPDTNWVRQIGRNVLECGVAALGQQGDDAYRKVVAVDQGNVVESLICIGREGEFSERCWSLALGIDS